MNRNLRSIQFKALLATQFFGALTIIGTIYIISLLPYSLIRLVVWILTHSLYRVKAVGAENVPKQGGALLISNHVTFVDPLLIGTSLDRHVRFVMLREIYHNPFLNWFFRLMKTIPISPKDPPKKMRASLQVARDAIASGELVCIFPEGHLTLTGHVRRFTRGDSQKSQRVLMPPLSPYTWIGSGEAYSVLKAGSSSSKYPKRSRIQ